MSRVKLSVIVVTLNRANMLARMLRALAAQTMPRAEWELIVVLDGCTDDSAEVCGKMAATLPNLRVLEHPQRRGQVHGLNTGLEIARGEGLAFTDDDCVPEPDWLERMEEALTAHEFVSGAIQSPGYPYWLLCHNIAQCHAYFPGRRGTPTIFAAGTNFGCRRAWLDALGGFDASGVLAFAPDMAVALKGMRRGGVAYFARAAIVTHVPDRTTFGSVMRYAAEHSRHTILLRNAYADVLGTPIVLRSPPLLALASPAIASVVTLGIYARNPSLWRRPDTAPAVFLIKMAWCYGAVMGLLRR